MAALPYRPPHVMEGPPRGWYQPPSLLPDVQPFMVRQELSEEKLKEKGEERSVMIS